MDTRPLFVTFDESWGESSVDKEIQEIMNSFKIPLNTRQRKYINRCLSTPCLVSGKGIDIDLNKLIKLR
jgi:hypothetical protein